MRDLPETDKRFFTYIPDDTVLDARIEKMIYEAVKEKGEEGLDKDFWMKAIDHMRTKQFITAIKVLTKRSLERINSFGYKVVNNIPTFQQEVSNAISGAISLVEAAKTLEFPRLAIYGTRSVQLVLAHAANHLHLIMCALIPNLKVKYGMIDDLFPQLEQIIKDAAKREEEYYATAKQIVRDASFITMAFAIYANVAGNAAIAAIEVQNRLSLLAAESTRRTVEVLRRGGQDSLLSKLIVESDQKANETSSIWDMLNNNTIASDLWKKISGEEDQQRIVIEASSPKQEGQAPDDSINATITSNSEQEVQAPDDSINATITSIRKMRRGERIVDVRYTHLAKQAGRRQQGLPSDFVRDDESIEDAWQRWHELTRRKKAAYIFLFAGGNESRVANTIAISPVEVNTSTIIEDSDSLDIFLDIFNSDGDENKLDTFAEASKNIVARSDNGSDIRSVLENISEDGLSELIKSFLRNEYDDDMEEQPLQPNEYDYVDIEPEEYISEDLEFPPFNSEDIAFQQARRLRVQNATHSFHYIIQNERAHLWLIRKIPCKSDLIRAAAEIIKLEKDKEKLVKTAAP